MKTIKNDYCIRQFVSSDTLIPAMTNVSLQDGYLYYTDRNYIMMEQDHKYYEIACKRLLM